MVQSKFAPPSESARRSQELFERHLAEKSLRLTPQRRLILDYFLHAEWHQSAEELYHQIRKLEPGIGFSTVYRTLKLLCECRLARELSLGDERSHFEPMYNVQHHDHLVCTECGKIIEFYSEEIEELQQKICAEHGFALSTHTHEVYGLCSECQKKSSPRITASVIDEHFNAEKNLTEFQSLKHKNPARARKLFVKIKEDLLKHMTREEEVLFPLFESRTGLQGAGPTAVMRGEHKQIRALLNRVGKGELPEKDLLKFLKRHEEKEEDVFYPWLDKMLSEKEKKTAVAQMGISKGKTAVPAKKHLEAIS